MQIPGYRIIRKINQGGMSTVYLAIQLSVGREVALKVMSPALNADPIFSERFQREASIVGQLSHPNIVAIYDIGRFKNLNYIAMDYLPGGSIHDKMSSGISADEALRIIQEVANALDHAHEKGYIHRDIKPENILFREDATAVLSDFGVAKTITVTSKMTNAGTVVGTPYYMSPEQARGKPIDGRSDLYSLGVVLYEMLTGSVPFRADEAVAIAIKHLTAPIPRLPPQFALFQPLLNKLLAKDADDRYQRGRDVTEAIRELQAPLEGISPRYLTETEPTAIQIMSLFKALLLTSYAAISAQLKELGGWLLGWRWMPKRGLYRHPRISVTEICTNSNTEEDERATVISTRIQRAAHYQAITSPRLRWATRTSSLALLLGSIWIAFSVSITRIEFSAKTKLPSTIIEASHKTELWLSAQLGDNSDNSDNNSNEDRSESGTAEGKAAVHSMPANNLLTLPSNMVATSPVTTEAATPKRPAPPLYTLAINAEPKGARVRILNIPEKYYPGIPLLPGRYHLEASHKGYDTYSEWIDVTQGNAQQTISLRKTPVSGAAFHNQLKDGDRGPAMIIIPKGSFIMGHKKQSSTAPTRRVRFAQPFAISQYEITFADYQKFSRASGRPQPADNRWGRGSRPVINISWQDAQAYTRWLRKNTGRKYRLPTEAEWEYAARANTRTDFWWHGDNKHKANCRRGCESQYSNLFRTKTAPVGNYPSNPFKLYDTAGNVAEWLQDCYKNHYLGAPKDGSAVSSQQCALRSVRGGSIKSSAAELKNHIRDKRNPTLGYSDVGFRVVVELY